MTTGSDSSTTSHRLINEDSNLKPPQSLQNSSENRLFPFTHPFLPVSRGRTWKPSLCGAHQLSEKSLWSLWSCSPVLSACMTVCLSVYALLACARCLTKPRIQMQRLLPPSCPLIFPSFMETGQDKRRWKREGAVFNKPRVKRTWTFFTKTSFFILALFTPPWRDTIIKSSHPAIMQTHHTHAHSRPVRCQWLWLGVLTLLSEFRSPSLVWYSHRPHLPTNSKTPHVYVHMCIWTPIRTKALTK